MVCTGAKRFAIPAPSPQFTALLLPLYYSEDLSRLAARKYARIIQKLGFPVSRAQFVCPTLCASCGYGCSSQARFMEFKIQNMVGSCDVKFPIRLEGLVINQPQFSRSVCPCSLA